MPRKPSAPPRMRAWKGRQESSQRCDSSPTTAKRAQQGRYLSKSDRSAQLDAARPYSAVQLAKMDVKFCARMAKAHPELGRR